MKATASVLCGWLALVLCFSANRVVEGATGGGLAVLVGAARAAQADGTSSQPDDKRQQAADLLRRARQAIRENDLPAADLLISQADALKVEYSPITMEDTPRKARQFLEQVRNANSGGSAALGQGFGRPTAPPSDPFYGRVAAPSPAVCAAGHAVAADRGRSTHAAGRDAASPPCRRRAADAER